MGRILLAEDSPHAQRMGERILREEGHHVVCVADGLAAAACLTEADPDLLIADVFLPGMDGLDLCRLAKKQRSHLRVVLTAGLLESFSEAEAKRAGCDAILKKPFEASVVAGLLRPLIEEAQLARGKMRAAISIARPAPVSDAPQQAAPSFPPDPQRVQNAVALAVEAVMPELIREITAKVLLALGHEGRPNGGL
jgi:CheY-like chemotaxis protein